MQIGSLVKYRNPYVDSDTADWIGVVIDHQSGGLRFLVEWNSGMRLWRHKDVLEVICK